MKRAGLFANFEVLLNRIEDFGIGITNGPISLRVMICVMHDPGLATETMDNKYGAISIA